MKITRFTVTATADGAITITNDDAGHPRDHALVLDADAAEGLAAELTAHARRIRAEQARRIAVMRAVVDDI